MQNISHLEKCFISHPGYMHIADNKFGICWIVLLAIYKLLGLFSKRIISNFFVYFDLYSGKCHYSQIFELENSIIRLNRVI